MDRSRSALSLHWPALLAVGLVVAAALVNWLAEPSTALKTAANFALVALPVAVAVAQYLYVRVERLHLVINGARLRITNPDVRIQVSAEFNDVDAPLVVKEISAEVEGRSGIAARALGRTEDGQIWNWSGKTLRLRSTVESDPVDGERDVVRLDMPEAHFSYRSAQRVLESDLGPLLCDIDTKVTSDDRKFALTIEFGGDNPFFGAFVKKVNAARVKDFRMTILEPEPGGLPEDVVTVGQDSLKLVASKAHSIQRLGLRYLRLRPS